MNTPEKQLSESLLAACKAAGIEKPKYIAQDKSGSIYHYNSAKPNMIKCEWLHDDDEDGFNLLDHPPYAEDWKGSLLEWVDPQGDPLADSIERHPDANQSEYDACEIAYQKMISEYAGRRTEAQIYERAWQDALADTLNTGQPKRTMNECNDPDHSAINAERQETRGLRRAWIELDDKRQYLEKQLREVTNQRDELAEALREMLKFTPRSLSCQDFHHATKDQNHKSDDCQPTKRFFDACAKAEQALAATK